MKFSFSNVVDLWRLEKEYKCRINFGVFISSLGKIGFISNIRKCKLEFLLVRFRKIWKKFICRIDE